MFSMRDERSREALKQHVLTHGCYSPEENQRIYNRWFAHAPRYRFRAVNAKYRLTDRVLCDVGCAYGSNLVFCAPGSYGIEVAAYAAAFARSLGLSVYERNALTDDLSDLPKVEAVWCSAVLEHVESPHVFLRKLHRLLKPDGLVAVYVPTIPLAPAMKRLPRIGGRFSGYLAGDHINAFVPATLRFFCERAGFETLEVSPFYPGALAVFNRLPPFNRLIGGCVYVGRKIAGWDYPETSTRRAADNEKGFVVR